MTDEQQLRPVHGEPKDYWEYDELTENPTDHSVGWALSWGCQLTFGFQGDELCATVSTSDADQRNGITVRTVTREQVADYARKLLALVEPNGGERPAGTADTAPPGLDHCQVVEVPTADGPRAIRVQSAAPMTAEAAAALGELVEAAERKMAVEYPHAGVIQELMLAWTNLRGACAVVDHHPARHMVANRESAPAAQPVCGEVRP